MKLFAAFMMVIAIFSLVTNVAYCDDVVKIDDNEIDKILKAKDIVRGLVNFPDTLVFHNFYTKVKGNTVTLKFTAKNAFGVPETHVKDITVN